MNTRTERHTTPQGFAEVGIVEHEGREYANVGALVSDTHLICYVMHSDRWQAADGHVYAGWAMAWNGEPIGILRIMGYATVPGKAGYPPTRLTCYRVRLDDGREYVGRGRGAGMILKCRRATTKGR